MPRGQGQAMALTTIYAKPDVPPRSGPGGCGKRPGPRWYWALLGAGWVGTTVLAGVVLWLLQRRGGNSPIPSQGMLAGTCSWETCLTNTSQQDIPEFKCSLSCFQSQLRQRLCEQGSHHTGGTSACRLCPAGWQPFAAKCYRVFPKTEAWEMAAHNCSYQQSQLVTLESVEEKAFIGQMIGNISGAWMGLSLNQTRGKEWTWWDGSPLQETLSPVVGPNETDACAAIWRDQLRSHICSTPLHWICQKEATKI